VIDYLRNCLNFSEGLKVSLFALECSTLTDLLKTAYCLSKGCDFEQSAWDYMPIAS